MSYLLKLAYKNVIREKRRTILTIAILAFGIGFYLFTESFVMSAQQISIRNMIEFDTGQFKIRSLKYDTDKPYSVSNFIEHYEEIESVLAGKDYVTGYTERIQFLAEADNGINSLPIVAVGVNPERESSVFTTTNFVEGGALEEGGVLVGKDLADDLEVGVGDWIYVTYRTGQGMIGSTEMPVTGIINCADPQVNTSSVFVAIADAQKMLNIDSVTEIAVATADYRTCFQYQDDLTASLGGYGVENWRQLGRSMIEFMNTDASFGFMFVVFIIVVALFGTINTMLLSVYEKQREIGMLKALGMTDGEVKRMFVIEGLIIGVIGSVAGMIFGTLINLPFIYIGFDFTQMMTDNKSANLGYRILGTLKGSWNLKSYFYSVIISILTTTLASFYPARKATLMQPVECLRITQ